MKISKDLEKLLRNFIHSMAHIDMMNTVTKKICADSLMKEIRELKENDNT